MKLKNVKWIMNNNNFKLKTDSMSINNIRK